MAGFEYTVESSKGFDDAVAAVERGAAEKGFRVLHTHDVAATLAEKGFTREPLKIVEVCNARYAAEVLEKDVRLALMLPCPISIYTVDGRTRVSTLLPTSMSTLHPAAGIEGVAAEVEKAVVAMVDGAR